MATRSKNSAIFREKSLERVSSPENLDSYIKSTTPSLWLLLGTVIIILLGIVVWGIFGKIDSAGTVGCSVENGTITAYIKEEEYEKLCADSYIEINKKQYHITAVNGPSIVSDSSDTFLVKAAEIEDDAWYYTITCPTELTDGEYKGTIIYEQINPISFIIN